MKNTERQTLVVKSNNLIRKTRYSLNEREQKVLIYLISQIKAEDKEFNKISITVKDYCKICNISYDGAASSSVKRSIKNLSDKSWWLKLNNSDVLFRWVENVEVQRGTITLKLSEFLKPYLLELKENFTKYEIINVLALRGKFSIRLYEIFKSYLWQGKFCIELEELKKILQCEHYKTFKDFRVRVLDYSLKEINDYTDIEIQYKPIKSGKKVVSIEFSIKEKKGVQMTLDTVIRQKERLDQ